MSVRRSRRSAYKSLIELEKRAKAAAPLFGDEALQDSDDQSFDAERQSDDGEDVVDSDFDEPEEIQQDDGVKAEKQARREDRKRRRSGRYVDPALKRNKLKVVKASPVQRKGKSGEDTSGGEAENMMNHRTSLRWSTQIASERAAEEREKRMADEEGRRRKKMMKEAEKPEERIMTQQEMLEEAKLTEIKNRESLKELLRLEEEKKRIPVRKKNLDVPLMSVKSRDGKQTVSFTSKEADARKEMFPHLY